MNLRVKKALPQAYLYRRLHSLLGLWLVIYIIEHLLTNSRAALWFGDNGSGFIHMVNALHNLPYLKVIELSILGLPILLHGAWGIQYIRTAKSNAYSHGPQKPHLPYPRNKAYSWQRLSSWVLLVGILLHVYQMRFLDYPSSVSVGFDQNYYMVKVSMDEGLYTLAPRIQVALYDQERIQRDLGILENLSSSNEESSFDPILNDQLQKAQTLSFYRSYIHELATYQLEPYEVVAVSHNFGSVILLTVRNTFKSPTMMLLYTLFVLAACFHAFNGLWTFLISWGIIATARSQLVTKRIVLTLMVIVTFMGLAAVWLTYWVNLRY